ncbi:MAG: T9SS type A sorting domain-containing protein [Dysgonamonadaceae bacterium]|nr:T9SS type A sorting domain-containing protein [Dysgonamonadaceae bacterium]
MYERIVWEDGFGDDRLSFYQTNNVIRFSEAISTVKLYSLQGQIVLTKTQTDAVNVACRAKDVYVLQLTDNRRLQSVNKIVIH